MEPIADPPLWAAALEASRVGVAMRQSAVAYPLANLVHLLGLVLLVGPILLLDLRLLGFGKAVAVDDAARLLTPFAGVGLALLVVTGPLLFAADARALSTNTLLLWKLAGAALGLANALAFRALWRSRYPFWDQGPPVAARAQALGSIGLWLGVAALGRLIAYV
ncbi:DUF6644 family protein [Methylopila turkensis]|uniref:Membrane protein n=1 Tax=Methylopila turkensis TaxID=1437816 RepID=A0A9W6JRR8_9HYPH|nr:DUF6644 family protein [Methylopila turkensis]GLK81149.1 membrane protein [Methylopila turkensis]